MEDHQANANQDQQTQLAVSPSVHPRKGLRHWLPHIVAGLAFLCLAVISVLFWLEVSKRFPHIEPGAYLGRMDGIVAGRAGEDIRFYVEKGSGNEDLLLAVLEEGWSPQILTLIVSGSGSGNSESVMPLSVAGPGFRLSLFGSEVTPGNYRGSVVNTSNKAQGKWTLELLGPGDVAGARNSAVEENTRLWLWLQAELSDVEKLIAQTEVRVPEKKAEVDNLAAVITEGEKLKAKANEKYRLALDELEKAKKISGAKAEEAKKVEGAYTVAKRVTGMGKLVSLSRESLEREWRWAESMLKTNTDADSEDLEAAYDRGQKILELKREIEREKERIAALSEPVEEGPLDSRPSGTDQYLEGSE